MTGGKVAEQERLACRDIDQSEGVTTIDPQATMGVGVIRLAPDDATNSRGNLGTTTLNTETIDDLAIGRQRSKDLLRVQDWPANSVSHVHAKCQRQPGLISATGEMRF